ncbi:MAG TPA: Xaa-Pro peptidase family protein [Chloroflexota bacterium]|nr:Xaa-Pro peptidase family protein [Chloroflexota bacterium]
MSIDDRSRAVPGDNRRLARLRERMDRYGLDAFIVSQPQNRRYLSGVTATEGSAMASAGWLVVLLDTAYFITTFLYLEAAQKECQGAGVVRAQVRIAETAVEVLSSSNARRVGIEASHLVFASYDELARAMPAVELVPVDGIVEDLRAVKSDDEIELIRRSAALTDAAFDHFLRIGRPEMSEREAAWELERYMRENGAEGMAFSPAVATGPHAAVPHHHPTDLPLGTGQPIWMDLGAQLDGYCSDLTRSFCFGRSDEKYENIWRLVLRAHDIAMAGLRPGVVGRDSDALAREVISADGLGDAFGHGLGHGVGLAIHERPRLARVSSDVLTPGMIVTVEPGIYLSGWGGVRIEDLVVVTEDGIEVLSRSEQRILL